LAADTDLSLSGAEAVQIQVVDPEEVSRVTR
jgi:hypothetical protein